MTDDCFAGEVLDGESGYQTCDLYLAAFFLAAGCHLVKSVRESKTRRVYFYFDKNSLITDLKIKYFSREAKVEALTFADHIKSLKSLCHNIVTTSYST